MTVFQRRVYDALKLVPEGKVVTYAELANYLKCRSSQAVGQALKKNPNAPDVPCHRVITSRGRIGGYMGKTEGLELQRKRDLLRAEGVHFDEKGFLIDLSQLYAIASEP